MSGLLMITDMGTDIEPFPCFTLKKEHVLRLSFEMPHLIQVSILQESTAKFFHR